MLLTCRLTHLFVCVCVCPESVLWQNGSIGVGPSDSDSGIAEISQPEYFGHPNQLRPAAPTQSTSSYVGYPSAMDTGQKIQEIEDTLGALLTGVPISNKLCKTSKK